MNREQRRAQSRQQRGWREERLELIDLRTVTLAPQMTVEECRMMVPERLVLNLEETGHPFHHKTASGVIVTPDPSLEFYLSKLPAPEREEIVASWTGLANPECPSASPVNRKYYGHDMYERL